jgi:hypothetical protein
VPSLSEVAETEARSHGGLPARGSWSPNGSPPRRPLPQGGDTRISLDRSGCDRTRSQATRSRSCQPRHLDHSNDVNVMIGR